MMIFAELIRYVETAVDPALKRRATVILSRRDGGRCGRIGHGGGDNMASRRDRMRVARRFNAGS